MDPKTDQAPFGSGADLQYEGVDFTQAELRAAMREAYDDIISFVTTESFAAFYHAMMAQPASARPSFVKEGLFTDDGLRKWDILVPPDILIQTSAFGDRRPTLFAVKKMMPERFQCVWENMNLTFNNEFTEADVPILDETAWRAPLPVVLQNSLIAHGKDLESLPADAGVKFGIYK